MHDHGSTTGKYDGLDRDGLRALVWADADDEGTHRLAYDPRFCRMFGTSAGLMLSQLVYWSGKGHDPDGYLFFTKDGMMERFGLGSRYEVDEARHRLEDGGVLEWTKKARRDEHGVCRYGPSPVLHYRVNLAALAEWLDRFGDDPEGTIASIKRYFKPSKVGGSWGHGVHKEQSRVGGLSSRGSAAQSAEGQRLKQSRVSGLNRSRSAALNTENTSETTDKENLTERTDRDLSEGEEPPSAPPLSMPKEDEGTDEAGGFKSMESVIEGSGWWREGSEASDRGDGVIRSEAEVFELARSFFGSRAHEDGEATEGVGEYATA